METILTGYQLERYISPAEMSKQINYNTNLSTLPTIAYYFVFFKNIYVYLKLLIKIKSFSHVKTDLLWNLAEFWATQNLYTV